MRVLYLMHVNWNWIRQRPHVLAEGLSRENQVRLMHFAMYHKSHRAAECPPPFPTNVLWRLPERLLQLGLTFEYFNAKLLKHQVYTQMRSFKPDVVWVTHPVFEPAVRDSNGCSVIYDCMDDHLAFNAVTAESLAQAEDRLVQRADLTIFSSRTLADRVIQRSSVRRAEIINNGVADSLLDRSPLIPANGGNGKGLVLGYFGTISHWFDWQLIMRVLESMPDARLRLAGPVETAIPIHPRIEHVGILPHASLTGFVKLCNVMIMPFIVNHLIEAVDPVKLYEYIAYGLPSLAPRYSETTRFAPWVNLYENGDDAVRILNNISCSPRDSWSFEERQDFLRSNSWTLRYTNISRVLQEVRHGA